MGSRDGRVDAYIRAAAPFARPILARLREAIHAGCPGVIETIKWGHPFFERRGVLCSMAAFRAHCAFALRPGTVTAVAGKSGAATGRFGRITRLADLPKDAELRAVVREAALLNEAGVKAAAGAHDEGARARVVPDDAARHDSLPTRHGRG